MYIHIRMCIFEPFHCFYHLSELTLILPPSLKGDNVFRKWVAIIFFLPFVLTVIQKVLMRSRSVFKKQKSCRLLNISGDLPKNGHNGTQEEIIFKKIGIEMFIWKCITCACICIGWIIVTLILVLLGHHIHHSWICHETITNRLNSTQIIWFEGGVSRIIKAIKSVGLI